LYGLSSLKFEAPCSKLEDMIIMKMKPRLLAPLHVPELFHPGVNIHAAST
jgi:hypothetical protein